MKVERTFDAALLKRLATDPAIFPWVSDDYTSDISKWEPNVTRATLNLVAYDQQGHFGFGIFIPRSHSCHEAHLGFLPRSYGDKSLRAFRIMLTMAWALTTASRVIGEIDVRNRRAIAFAKRAGCQIYGINHDSILRGGKLHDQVCLGISRP